jgi:hypothetical protein
MTSPTTSLYQPGVCNIGPAEISSRRRFGIIGLVVAVAFLVVAVLLGWPSLWRLFVFIPVALGANGFLQAGLHFCVNFGMRGLFNFGELGTEENIMEKEFRAKDQRKAVLIIVLTIVIAAAFAGLSLLIPTA